MLYGNRAGTRCVFLTFYSHWRLVCFARPPTKEMTLEMNFDQARKRAESTFKKEERARDGAKAMSEYEANIRAVREKTARLRALRLAKEASENEAQPTKKKPG